MHVSRCGVAGPFAARERGLQALATYRITEEPIASTGSRMVLSRSTGFHFGLYCCSAGRRDVFLFRSPGALIVFFLACTER